MPTVTGPDGVKKEISMEDFKQTVQNGGRLAYVQRSVTGPDGQTHTSTIYGNNPGVDSADWSVELFMDMETVFEIIRICLEELSGPERQEDPAEKLGSPNTAYAATVDFTDTSVMCELTIKKDSVELDMSIRDEHKSAFGEARSSRWNMKEEGIELDLSNVEEDKSPLYLLAFTKVLKYLKKTGQLDELKKLENRSAGAIVTAKKDSGTISARIVRGRQRPELLCITGFLGMGGEQMCRPYLDELLGIADMTPLEQRVELAEGGDTSMMESLAMTYLNGDGVDADPEKAAHWFQKLAEAGESNGMFNLGLLYAKGYGVKRDFARAAYWMEQAAAHGDTDAPPMAEEYRKMAKGLQKAEAGDAQAQADLASGLMSLGGSLDQAGAGDDYTQSVYWAQKAAEQNNGDGIWTLALAYEHGRSVEQDKKKAVELYRRGAELGHAACQHSLGCYHMRGEVVPKDEKEAFRLILQAAEQGYGLAMRDAGRCYQFGNGVQDDMEKAIEWYEKALQVIDDEELAQKVAIFKMIDGKEHMAKVAADPAEQTRRKKEKEAEEAKKREQEQARKAAEEKKRQQEQAKEAAYKAWQEQAARCKEQREQEVKRLMDEKRVQLLAELERRRDAKLAEVDKTYAALREQKQTAEQTLASLGLFKMGAKKEKRAEIERLTGEMTRQQEQRSAALKEYDRDVGGLERQLAGQKPAIERQANETYPMPAEPEKPASVIRQEKKQQAEQKSASSYSGYDMYQEMILAVMEPGKYYTMSEIADMVPALTGAPPQRLSGILRGITNEPEMGITDRPLNKVIDKRRALFILA